MAMKITGVIAEYNPFHTGHLYQLQKAREITGADYIIIVMSGNFTQRGTPALLDKYDRARMALLCGADLVIELPVCYATGSAEYFAGGAIALLSSLGCVDSICFGSECGNITQLTTAAKALVEESGDYKRILKNRLKVGKSFPAARNEALMNTVDGFASHTDILGSPNNILGIEYIKAIIRQKSPITPYTNLRIGSDYHSYKLADAFSSAISIRQSLAERDDLSLVCTQMPPVLREPMERGFHKTYPIFANDFSSLLHVKLLKEQAQGFTRYLDVTKEISDKICSNIYKMQGFEGFCNLLKTKNLTYARISRCLSHILLDIREEEMAQYKDNGLIYYARILGLGSETAALTKKLKQNTSVPLITRAADASVLYPLGKRQFDADILAAHTYECVAGNKYGAGLQDEYHRRIVKI